MNRPVRVAIDAMGGDHGPGVTVAGADIAHRRRPDSEFLLYGDEAVIEPLLRELPKLRGAAKVVHTDVAIRMDDKPSQALRYGRRNSSMWLAIDAVRHGQADVAVSAGNTGALMAMAKICLKTLPGVDRPAIAGIWPTLRGESIVLDLGASIGADAHHYVNMAMMGAAMARIVFGHERPTVGLLNVGVEEIKGVEEVREAGTMLREMGSKDFEYHGFVEGDDLGRGTVDVVVTEGFAGNIALKAAEGTAKQIGEYLRAAMRRTWRAQLGYLLAREAFRAVSEKVDPRKVNGGVFLGLNGLVVKSHGGTDAEGFASAIDIGYDVARHELVSRIAHAIGGPEDRLAGLTENRAAS
jgi:glycerol-3-phosphate acyltransferase PlsX